MIGIKSFFIVLCLSVLMTDANASVSKGYNRAHLLAQIKRAIKSPKIPGSPNIPTALIGLGVTGLIDGIEKIQKDMENPNFIDEQAREHISHTDTQTTHGGGGGAIGYDYIFDGTVYSSPDEVRSAMLRRIDENGWKLTRQRDGYYYQHWQVNMENRTMKLYAQVGRKDDPVCANLCLDRYQMRCQMKPQMKPRRYRHPKPPKTPQSPLKCLSSAHGQVLFVISWIG